MQDADTNAIVGQQATIEKLANPRLAPSPLPNCSGCKAPARVHILRGYSSGAPLIVRLCLACANREAESRAIADVDVRRRVGMGSLLVFLGTLLALSGSMSAFFQLPSHAGFGWIQTFGVGLGAFLAVCGGLLKIDLLAVAGAFLVGLMAGLDWLDMREHQQNWIHQAGACCGLASMLIGLGILRRRNEKRRQKKD